MPSVAPTPRRPRIRLVAFDMDSTLIQAECIDRLAEHAGPDIAAQVAAVTDAAMRGELDFAQSLRQRVALLRGLDANALDDVFHHIQLTPGARELCRALKRRGVVLAMCTGGFHCFASRFADTLGIDHVCANRLEVQHGRLTGRVVGRVVDAQRKAIKLVDLADLYGMLLRETAAIGDGANDLPMIKAAGVGIAFCAKPALREHADATIDSPDLQQALPLLGFA